MASFQSDEIYTLEMYNRNGIPGQAYCDLLVLDSENKIYAANIIGADARTKQTAFLIQEGKTGNFRRAEGNRFDAGHIRKTVYAIDSKKNSYDEEVSKIEDLTQIFMVSKQAKPNLKGRNAWKAENVRRVKEGDFPLPLPEDLAELILAWDGDYKQQVYEVLDDRYNTPMLTEWKDVIIDACVSLGYYEPLYTHCFGSTYTLEAGLLKITEEQLEDIITQAIQGYEFEFAIEEDGRRPNEGIISAIESIDGYLAHFAGELGAVIQENIGLRFDPNTDRHHSAFEDVNLQANHNGLTGLYPPQANTVMGVSKTLEEEDFCFIIGEMG